MPRPIQASIPGAFAASRARRQGLGGRESQCLWPRHYACVRSAARCRRFRAARLARSRTGAYAGLARSVFAVAGVSISHGRNTPGAGRPAGAEGLHRNTNRIQEKGGRKAEVLHASHPAEQGRRQGARLRQRAPAERGEGRAHLRRMAQDSPDEAYNDLQYTVQDDTNVHRVVAAPGGPGTCSTSRQGARPHAAAAVGPLLRQGGGSATAGNASRPRTLLPKLLDQYKLLEQGAGQASRRTTPGSRSMASTIFAASRRARPPTLAAAALAEGIAPEVRRRGDLAGRQPAGPPRPRPPAERRSAPASRSAASTATRSASTPATRPTPGGTSPASATPATRSPA